MSLLLSDGGCCWYQPTLCQPDPTYRFGLAPPTPLQPLQHALTECPVCPSAVASTIEVPVHRIPTLQTPQIPYAPEQNSKWPLTLYEALDIALQNAEVVRSSGLVAAESSNIDRIRGEITRYDQIIAAYQADGSWGVFDPQLTTEMAWNRTDIPPGTSFGGIGNRPPQLDNADFELLLEQLTPSGTRWHINYSTDYLFNPARPVSLNPNPQHFSILQFGLQQPLLQGLGMDVNLAPIRIAAARAEQSGWQFKREMLAMVRSVESAFWQLYALQRDLEVIDKVIPLLAEIVRIQQSHARTHAGTMADVARAEADLLFYQQRRLDLLSVIEEQQLVVRDLLGIAPYDGRDLEPMALPEVTLPTEGPQQAFQTALNLRPDILRQRLAVYVAGQERIVARDSLRPQLDGFGSWRLNGLNDDLGGSLEQLFEDDYHDWELGLRLEVPLGRRQAWADVRAANNEISRQRALLEQRAHQASFEIADAYRRLYWLHREYTLAMRRTDALQRWQQSAKAIFENPPSGTELAAALASYVDTLERYVDATTQQHAVLADFNSALARLDEVKGTLLTQRDIQVVGDPTESIHDRVDLPSVTTPMEESPLNHDPSSADSSIAPMQPSMVTPQPDAPHADVPSAETPHPDSPRRLPPPTEPPPTESPPTESPSTESPSTEPFSTEPEHSEPSSEELPQEKPPTDAPSVTPLPASDSPASDSPASDSPASDSPATGTPDAVEPDPPATATLTKSSQVDAPATQPPLVLLPAPRRLPVIQLQIPHRPLEIRRLPPVYYSPSLNTSALLQPPPLLKAPDSGAAEVGTPQAASPTTGVTSLYRAAMNLRRATSQQLTPPSQQPLQPPLPAEVPLPPTIPLALEGGELSPPSLSTSPSTPDAPCRLPPIYQPPIYQPPIYRPAKSTASQPPQPLPAESQASPSRLQYPLRLYCRP